MSEDSSKYEMETMVSSSSKDATMCLACGAQVFTDFGSSSKSAKISLRCGNCGDLIGTGVKANAPREKTASRSLWLGLSSIILLFFTGIPAIYYGIKSLLKKSFFFLQTCLLNKNIKEFKDKRYSLIFRK